MRITVVGDVLLDEDPPDRAGALHPGAPAPDTRRGSRVSRAGGAGLLATMLRDDGHEVELLTALGDDEGASRLRAHLQGVEVIACASSAPTPVRTRPRTEDRTVDPAGEGGGMPPLPRVTSRMLQAVARADAIVVADHGYRLLEHPELRVAVHRRGHDAPLVWAPHHRGADPVPASWLVTRSLPDATAAAGIPAHPSAAVDAAAEIAAEAAGRLQRRYGCRALAITLGKHGALLVEEDGEPLLVRSAPVESADTYGAGCRFVATAATVFARGGDRREAVRSGVEAAGAYLATSGIAALGTARPTRPPDPAPDTGITSAGPRSRAAGGGRTAPLR